MQRPASIILLLLLAPGSVFAEETIHSRWAVIATDEVSASGLPDLLTAALSERESLQLVERERLSEVLRELQFSTMLPAERVDQRLQLGRILKANALMVLSFEKRNEERLLKVVICDADLGVRLSDCHFHLPDNGVEELVAHCVSIIDEVRQRFSDGIQHIIAVPVFLSEDFEHHFDWLQTRYRDQLAGSLTAHPGVAVVEIEEARAILRELQSVPGSSIDRPITSTVQATYRVTSPNPPRVTLRIEVAHDDHESESIEKSLTLDSVGRWLTTDFTRKLLASTTGRRPSVSLITQKAILTRHADRFAALGNWEQSIPLREAALVLDPLDPLQRALLVSEYQYRFLPEIKSNWHPAVASRPIAPNVRERALSRAVHDYRVGLDHLTWLIRNRLIHRVDAIGLLTRHRWYQPPYQIVAAPDHDSLKRDVMQFACSAQRQFLHEVYPLVEQLPKGRRLPKQLSEPFYGAQHALTCHVISDVGFNRFCSESLECLGELLTHHLSGDARTQSSLLGLISYTYAPRPSDASYPAWIKLWQSLRQSDRELARIYARYALALDQLKTTESTAGLEQLLADVVRTQRVDEPIHDVLQLRLRRLKPLPAHNPATVLSQIGPGPLGRMKLEPLSLTVETENASDASLHITGMLRCGQVDAYWTRNRFFVMQQRDLLNELKLTDHDADHPLFREVSWDGKYLWLQAYGRGIVAVKPDGTGLVSFKGMTPGYSKGLGLLGLSPGTSLAAGSFGRTNRVWCGLLSVNEEGQHSVNVFFEAKDVAEGRDPAQASADTSTVFQPEDLSRVTSARGRKFVLVGRRGLSPMLVDPETLTVTVPDSGGNTDRLSTDTELGYQGRLFLRDGVPVRVMSGVAISRNSRRIVFHNDWLYRPGYIWVRQHVETGKLERLQARTLPHQYWDLRVGSSAHYGLVTYSPYSSQPVSRLTILHDNITTN